MSEFKIIETEFGIANTYGTEIELNSHLSEFPELRKKIINHEIEHARENSSKSSSFLKRFYKNRKIDALTDIKFRDLIPFIKKYPKSFFQQILPFNYSKEKDTIFIEWSLIFFYLFVIGIIALCIKLITMFADTPSTLFLIIKNIILISIISIGVYFLGKYIVNKINNINWKGLAQN